MNLNLREFLRGVFLLTLVFLLMVGVVIALIYLNPEHAEFISNAFITIVFLIFILVTSIAYLRKQEGENENE